MTPAITPARRRYRVVVHTWQNGRLIDQQVVGHADSFEQATLVARALSGERVRLGNDDFTVSIEPADASGRGSA